MAGRDDTWMQDAAGGARPGRPELLIAPPTVLERGLSETVGAAKLFDALRPVVVVAPDVATSATVERVLACGLGAVVNVEVFAFPDLIRTLSSARHRAQGRAELEPARERALVALVAARAKGWFEPLAGTAGFAEEFRRFLAELRGARMSAGAVTRAGLPIEIRRKLSSIATCADDFESRRDRRHLYEDRVEDATVVAERTMKAVPVMWYGVQCTSDTEARFLERLCHAASVTAFLPSTRPPATAALEPTLRALKRAGVVPMTEPPAPETADGATALSHLHRNLYRMADAAAPQDGSVELVLVQDPAAEAEEAAAACLRWAADGLTFADMAVVCPSEGPQAGLVTAALDRGGIPWVRHHPLPLVSTAPGRGALLLALLASGPLCGQVFFDFLATADVADAIRSEFAPFDPDRWARLARRCGLDSSDAVEAAAWESRLAALVSDLAAGSGDPDPADVSAAESLRRIVSALAADLSPPEETTWAAHTSWFDDLVRRYLAEPDAVAVALAPLSTMDEVGPLDSTEAFVSQVRLTIESSPSAPPPPAALARTGVSVLGVQDVGLAAYEAVCLLGAADGYLPRPAARAVLLDDAERRKLNEVLSADLPLAATAHASDPLDFAAAVWAARSRLLVVRPRTTISGAPLAPSPYFRAALIALKGDVIDVSACDHDALVRHGHLTEVAWAVDEAAAAAALVADAGTTCLSAGAARGRVAWLSRRRGNELTAYEGLVDPATVEALPEALNPLGGALSPTRLETYAGCPFRYLAENVLGLHGAPARDDMDSRHRGSLVHEILERFLDAATAEPEQSEEDETELLDRTAGEVLEAWENRGRTPTAAAWKVTRSQILADLRRWWEIEREAADSGWRPQLLEAPFGRPDAGAGAEHAPLVLETDSGPMSFGGRIDRVDVNAEGDAFRVVDYKTGAVGKAADGPDGGRSLQLPLYLRAAAQMLELPLQAGSAQYFYVTRRGGFLRRQSWADEAALTRLLSSLRASLAAGDFHPEPGPACTTAGGCEFRSVCGRQVESVMHTRRRDRRHTDYTDRFETIREAVTGGAS